MDQAGLPAVGDVEMRQEIVGALLLAGILAGLSDPTAAQTSHCDKPCLMEVMDRFVDEMTGSPEGVLPISPSAEVRENTRRVELDATAWKDVASVRSRITFADPITGNVVSRSGVELSDGRPGYISTRIKILDGEVVDVELSSDTSERVVEPYVYSVAQKFAEPLPMAQRSSRNELEAIARRYFQDLTDHSPDPEDHVESCNRFHSGQQITNVELNAIEAGGMMTCFSSLGGSPPWGPAAEQRFPVIDPDSGIVFGVTLLHFDDGRQMYVSEVFRIVGGRIALIDNIGLMLDPPVETLGFTH